MISISEFLLAGAILLGFGAAPLAAQETAAELDLEAVGGTVLYEREVFDYSAAGRPDPFRSLLSDAELGVRVEDLTLRGVVYNRDPSLSVAVLTQQGSDRRIRARVGERVGSLRILAIEPDHVEIVVEELGVARRETLRITRPENGGVR